MRTQLTPAAVERCEHRRLVLRAREDEQIDRPFRLSVNSVVVSRLRLRRRLANVFFTNTIRAIISFWTSAARQQIKFLPAAAPSRAAESSASSCFAE